MHVSLNRGQIREMVLDLLTQESLGDAVTLKQLNAFINLSYAALVEECTWVKMIKTARQTLGIDQVWMPFPADAEPGGILSVAYWDGDEGRAIPITPAPIQAHDDLEELNAAGGSADETARDDPRHYDFQDGKMRFWRPAKVARTIIIQYRAQALLVDDADVPLVDGYLLVQQALVHALNDQGDEGAADRHTRALERRLAKLRGNTHLGQAVIPGDVLGGDPEDLVQVVNWDRRPTTRP